MLLTYTINSHTFDRWDVHLSRWLRDNTLADRVCNDVLWRTRKCWNFFVDRYNVLFHLVNNKNVTHGKGIAIVIVHSRSSTSYTYTRKMNRNKQYNVNLNILIWIWIKRAKYSLYADIADEMMEWCKILLWTDESSYYRTWRKQRACGYFMKELHSVCVYVFSVCVCVQSGLNVIMWNMLAKGT